MADRPDIRDRLRDAILRGVYAPRQRLIEADLAEDLGASRSALRTALVRLEGEGLVELQPNRGARVREVTVDEAVEIAEIRRTLEGFVAARAAQAVTDAQIIVLRQLGEQMRTAVANDDLLRYSELNQTLHSLLREIAGHLAANRVLDQLHGQLGHHRSRLVLVPGRAAASLPEHLAIIDGVCSRDPVAAETAMLAHIGGVVAALTAFAESASIPEPTTDVT